MKIVNYKTFCEIITERLPQMITDALQQPIDFKVIETDKNYLNIAIIKIWLLEDENLVLSINTGSLYAQYISQHSRNIENCLLHLIKDIEYKIEEATIENQNLRRQLKYKIEELITSENDYEEDLAI